LVFTAVTGVVKFVPVPKETPPVEDAYQLITPAEAVAVKVATPAPQMVVGDETLVIVGIV